MAVDDELDWRSYHRRAGFRWATYELFSATVHAAMFGWGFWMLGAYPLRISIVSLVIWFLIVSGIAWDKQQKASLLMMGTGLIVWSHVPIIDHALEVAQNWQP